MELDEEGVVSEMANGESVTCRKAWILDTLHLSTTHSDYLSCGELSGGSCVDGRFVLKVEGVNTDYSGVYRRFPVLLQSITGWS